MLRSRKVIAPKYLRLITIFVRIVCFDFDKPTGVRITENLTPDARYRYGTINRFLLRGGTGVPLIVLIQSCAPYRDRRGGCRK
jgi:hypothetical protein